MTRNLARLARISDHARAGTPAHAGRLAGGVIALAAIVFAAACVEGNGPGGGVIADSVPPVVTVTAAAPSSDSVVAFNVVATDNLGLLDVHVSVAGPGISGAFDTTFNTAVTNYLRAGTLAPYDDHMKAVILAGGRGTRISEESQLRPKPMIEIGGRPIL